MSAAAPGITMPRPYRPPATVSTGDIVVVVVGIAAMLIVSAVVMMIWSRLNARQMDATTLRDS
jgi:hypothetical protein